MILKVVVGKTGKSRLSKEGRDMVEKNHVDLKKKCIGEHSVYCSMCAWPIIKLVKIWFLFLTILYFKDLKMF